MGLLIVPLATTIMSCAEPENAGAASGAMTTMQNVGAALGVAVTGVIFFGALHGGYAHALELSLAQLGVLLLAVAGLTRLLPEGERELPAGAVASTGELGAAAVGEPA